MNQPKNTLVIPVHNNVHLTVRCLNSVLANTSPMTKHIFVVDDFSTDSTPEVLTDFSQKFLSSGWSFEVITNQGKNQGFGRAVNAGARRAKTEYVSILNNDTWVMKNWDQILIDNIARTDWLMISPFAYEGPFDLEAIDRIANAYTVRNKGKRRPTWSSILMMFKTKALEDLDYFDERFFVTYEDTDLRERMNRGGFKYGQTGECFIWHKSMGTRQDGSLPTNYEIEGKRLFIEKWGFDPSVREANWNEKLKRKWQKIKNSLGYF